MQAHRFPWLRASANTLLLAGLIALGWSGVYLLRMYLYQINGAATLNREMRMRLRPMREQTAPVLHTGALLGMLNIPRANVSSVILEGDDDRTLAVSVGHIPGTALPGQDGNVVLAGHRDTFFRGLSRIRPHDEILLTTPDGTRLYQVDSTRVVEPEDTAVLDISGRPLLTLVTCYPFHYIGPAPERFVVVAHALDQVQASNRD